MGTERISGKVVGDACAHGVMHGQVWTTVMGELSDIDLV